VAVRAVEARRPHIEAYASRCAMIAMSRVRRNAGGEIEDAPMILYRARGESREADMVFIIIIECIDVMNLSRTNVLTERERLFATAALNSSGLLIMSSNKEHL
jgi:hypothetical protein